MKIGIDIQTTLSEKTGFGFYVKNLVKHLKKIDHKNRYFFFRPVTDVDLSTPQRFLWDQFQIPRQAQEKRIDILHQPCFSAPVFYRGKVIVTVHDLIARLYRKDIPFFSRQFFGKWMPFSYHWATKIIAISENTKRDLIELLKIPVEKIEVIYLAAGEEFQIIKDKEQIEKIKKKYHTGNKYFLHIGTLNPRKNLEFLIQVFSQVIKSHPDYNLVITGKKGWYYEGLFGLVKRLGLEQKVIFTGYIPDQDSPCLYNGADLFLFPSLYEGFGLPPLEAMACGVPVISSNTSSLPEVVGKGGLLLSPHNELAWVQAIKRVLTDSRLRRKLSLQGKKQSAKFSWQKCAYQTLSIYEAVYKR